MVTVAASERSRIMVVQDLSKAELRQVLRHREQLADQRADDVSLDEAAEDWLAHYSQAWRETRQAKMMALQCEEIHRYKWIESEKARRDVGKTAAAEWISKYAAKWRAWYETKEEVE
jgi:16S rRNA C967 or C1407 C5-methylase (RsmB/RsmF family)